MPRFCKASTAGDFNQNNTKN